jgi:hypothetical protein
MSDALLTRIAEALEKLVYHLTPPPPPAPAAEAPKKGRPPKAVADAPAPAASPAPAAQTAPASVAVAEAPAVADPDLAASCANVLIDLANNFSRDAAVAVLAKYKAQKVSQVKPSDLGALLVDLKAALEAEKAKKANESLV